jgi:hypothetical protein
MARPDDLRQRRHWSVCTRAASSVLLRRFRHHRTAMLGVGGEDAVVSHQVAASSRHQRRESGQKLNRLEHKMCGRLVHPYRSIYSSSDFPCEVILGVARPSSLVGVLRKAHGIMVALSVRTAPTKEIEITSCASSRGTVLADRVGTSRYRTLRATRIVQVIKRFSDPVLARIDLRYSAAAAICIIFSIAVSLPST